MLAETLLSPISDLLLCLKQGFTQNPANDQVMQQLFLSDSRCIVLLINSEFGWTIRLISVGVCSPPMSSPTTVMLADEEATYDVRTMKNEMHEVLLFEA